MKLKTKLNLNASLVMIATAFWTLGNVALAASPKVDSVTLGCYQTFNGGLPVAVVCVFDAKKPKVAIIANDDEVLFCKTATTVKRQNKATVFQFKGDQPIEIDPGQVLVRVEQGELYIGRASFQYSKLNEKESLEITQVLQSQVYCPLFGAATVSNKSTDPSDAGSLL